MRKVKPQQTLLGLMAPRISAGAARFEAETRRRGGPLEVAGKRFRGIKAQREQHEAQQRYANVDVILGMHGLVKKMPKVESDD